DFHLAKSNNKVIDMMNVKYIIQGEGVRPNPSALGGAWFVEKVESVQSPNDEILALGAEFKLKNEGGGQLLINNEVKNEVTVYGGESMIYLTTKGDSLEVPLSNGIMPGMEVYFVADAKGQTNLVPKQSLELDTANSFAPLFKLELQDRFEPATEAVMLASEAKELSSKSFSGQGTIETVSYKPNHITYSSNSDQKQLA